MAEAQGVDIGLYIGFLHPVQRFGPCLSLSQAPTLLNPVRLFTSREKQINVDWCKKNTRRPLCVPSKDFEKKDVWSWFLISSQCIDALVGPNGNNKKIHSGHQKKRKTFLFLRRKRREHGPLPTLLVVNYKKESRRSIRHPVVCQPPHKEVVQARATSPKIRYQNHSYQEWVSFF